MLSFASSHDAVSVKMRMRNRLKFNILPTPRELASGCGISISIEAELFTDVQEILREAELNESHVQIYKIVPAASGKHYEKM